MKKSNKRNIVIKIPLEKLWKNNMEIIANRNQYLSRSQVEDKLKKQNFIFIIANIGDDLQWIDIENCYDFWNKELKSHCVENYEGFDLDEFEENYCYVASEWKTNNNEFFIVLEMFH